MTFPIKLDIGFIVDLRYIPFILASLYGGYKMAFPLYIVLNIERFLIGGEGIIQSFIYSSVVFLVIPALHTWFIKLNSHKKMIYGTVTSFVNVGIYLLSLSLQIPVNREFWTLSFYTVIYYIVVMIIMIILIERIFTNIKVRETIIYSERLNALSELSASVAHEIRNPLTVTHGFLQLLQQSKTNTSTEQQYIEYSLKELKRAEDIVSEFLALSKPQCENMVYSNFKNEIEYVKNIIIPYANLYHVTVQITFNNSLNKEYDKNQFHQCFINLLKNGIESMKETGGIIYMDVYEKNNKIIIKIKDNGNGMTKEEIQQLGKAFYSTKEKGTGLGMLMVYNTIHKAKGKIEVESEKGKGTTFLITLPV